ncbi:MAG TPA: hypothetical protein VMI10_10450 [Terriglobales bacterium]|nr:hypothetical protein [Terriglobales bacterium]HTT21699.1 hypothetical protein [Candidatus Sulfotelmatobacter sp.]
MAKHLENETYLLDDTERQAYAPAARLVARVDHRHLDLTQPLAGFDYLLIMCAHLIVTGEKGVDERLSEIVTECLDERHRHAS